MATGTEIITQAKELADMVNSNFIGLGTWRSWCNDAYFELYDLLVSRFEDYYVTSQSVNVSPSDSAMTLPAAFYKLRGLDRDGKSVRSFPFAERNSVDVSAFIDGVYPRVRYCIMGSQILLRPIENAPGDYTIWFIPRPTKITNFDDQIVGIDGWETFLHYTIAIKALMKEESDATGLMALKGDIVRRIEEMAANRDAGEPKKISDVQRFDYRFSILGY